MAQEKSPAFQFYPKDFLADANVRAMSLEEVGAYWMLVSICWNEHSLPNDTKKLARLLGVTARKFDALWPAIVPCFEERNDRIVHPRLELERARQQENSEKRKRAAESRWNASAMQVQCPASSSATASATAIKEKHRAAGAAKQVDGFAQFWAAYPKRAGGNPRKRAVKAWSARIREGVDPEAISAGLERYRAYLKATGREGTEYVLQAATFLGPDHRWEEAWTPPAPRAPPGSEASQRREELPGQGRGGSSAGVWTNSHDPDRERREVEQREAAELRQWEDAHPEMAKQLRDETAREIASDGTVDKSNEITLRLLGKAKYLAKLRRAMETENQLGVA